MFFRIGRKPDPMRKFVDLKRYAPFGVPSISWRKNLILRDLLKDLSRVDTTSKSCNVWR